MGQRRAADLAPRPAARRLPPVGVSAILVRAAVLATRRYERLPQGSSYGPRSTLVPRLLQGRQQMESPFLLLPHSGPIEPMGWAPRESLSGGSKGAETRQAEG